MINFFIILFGVPIMRKYLQTEINAPKWDYYLKILRVFGPILFVFNLIFDEQEYTFQLLWDCIFLFIIYVIYELRTQRIAQVLLRATAPLVAIFIIDDLLVFWTPEIAEEYDSQIDIAKVFGFLWLFAFGVGASNQHKSFLAEQKKREEEEAERHLLEAKKLELEYQVTERTAELVKQKEELLHALEDLKTTQNQLVQKEKLASLGELTAGIAHEIQNPLNFVNNFSELSVELAQELIEELEKPEIDKLYLAEILGDLTKNQEKINHHGKRASSIVKGMLEHSRTGTGEREMTDINKLADEYLRLSYHGMRAKFKDFNADYEFVADETLPLINCVPQDIGRVLLNLINNAFYATNLGEAKPTVELLADVKSPKVIVRTEHANNQLTIKVIDNGTGMSREVQEKIFQPFFTTKPTGEGTGLGLSLTYDIITKGHGGSIEVESEENIGTTFTIKLPINN